MPLHCTRESIYREIRRTVGPDNVDLGVVEVSGKPQEPTTDSEPPSTSINQPTTSNRQKMSEKKPCQPNIEDIEKVRSHNLWSSSTPQDSHLSLSGTNSLLSPHPFYKSTLPMYQPFHCSQTNVLSFPPS